MEADWGIFVALIGVHILILTSVKSGSSGLKPDGGSGREMEVSHRGGPEIRWRYENGGLSKDLA